VKLPFLTVVDLLGQKAVIVTMRCEQCGRDMKNAELWRLATDPKAPTSWSMKQLCWDCREHPERASEPEEAQGKLAQDVEVVPGSRNYDFGGYDTPPQ
jgi:hypothetical protein